MTLLLEELNFFLRFYLIKTTCIHSARYQSLTEEYITSDYTITLQL